MSMMRGLRMHRRRGLFVAFCWVGVAVPAFALLLQESAPDLVKIADEMTRAVVRLRGLESSGPIQKGVKSREEISRYLSEHIHLNFDEDELLKSGKVLQKLALIPAGMNYREFMLKLLTEQVGGFYDPEKKTFFIAGWLPADQQKPVMVHELTHALQDQHYDLNRVLQEDRKLQNDDRLLAHMALFEGDATAVMLDFLLEPAGRNFTQLPNLVFIMHAQFASMEAQYEVFRQAPAFIKETLVFPYAFGTAFLQKARASQPWSAVNKIYSDLPASTEQVMHPEKYIGTPRDNPRSVEVTDPSLRLGNEWKITYRNVLGEFTLSLMLRIHLAEARTKAAAEGWGGDKVFLLEDKNGAAAVFCATVWDTPEDADEFYQAMGDWLQAQYPKSHRVDESTSGFGLIQSGEYHSLKKDGSRVEFVIGLPEAESSKIRPH